MSLCKTRYLINLARNRQNVVANLLLLIIDFVASFALAVCAAFIGTAFSLWIVNVVFRGVDLPIDYTVQKVWSVFRGDLWTHQLSTVATVWFIPAFFGRFWMIAYVISGLLWKVARPLDRGFAWFNRRFDVENNPLQCIGLVAGTLAAIGYWLLAAVRLVP